MMIMRRGEAELYITITQHNINILSPTAAVQSQFKLHFGPTSAVRSKLQRTTITHYDLKSRDAFITFARTDSSPV